MGERVGPWWMPCPCHADECPPHYSSFHHSAMMHLMIIILKNMMEMEIFMMKRYQILIIHPQHQHHRHHQVTNSKTPLATCMYCMRNSMIWSSPFDARFPLPAWRFYPHNRPDGWPTSFNLDAFLLFAFSVVLQIIMNIIFLTISISVIHPVITIINMIFVTSHFTASRWKPHNQLMVEWLFLTHSNISSGLIVIYMHRQVFLIALLIVHWLLILYGY